MLCYSLRWAEEDALGRWNTVYTVINLTVIKLKLSKYWRNMKTFREVRVEEEGADYLSCQRERMC